jgi:hypothetical protein
MGFNRRKDNMTRIRYKEYPCGNHRSNHVFAGSDYYRARLIPPRSESNWKVQITNSKEEILHEGWGSDIAQAKAYARQQLLSMGAKLFDEVRRKK